MKSLNLILDSSAWSLSGFYLYRLAVSFCAMRISRDGIAAIALAAGVVHGMQSATMDFSDQQFCRLTLRGA
jgi:hypothetical protein